ncbi:MAG: TPM domain-containing protein [Spirochaetales bacterium]|nr:TPM domain-containing protein [Spirochaetales bacterium]
MKAPHISKEDHKRIEEEVARAEKKTSGEIATALIEESSDYALYELIFALAGGAIAYFIGLLCYGSISRVAEGLFWEFKPIYTTIALGGIFIVVSGLLYLIANIPGFDRLIVPKAIMTQMTDRRAARHFMEAGLFDTRDRTGILIFVSRREQRVEILADKGINDVVKEGAWDEILAKLIEGIRADRFTDSLIEAVDACGTILADHFPIKDDDTNELSDGLSILED